MSPWAQRAPDLVNREFVAIRRNQLFVSDFTYVSTWSGTVYVAFVIDVFSRFIVAGRHRHAHRTRAGRTGDGDLATRRPAPV